MSFSNGRLAFISAKLAINFRLFTASSDTL